MAGSLPGMPPGKRVAFSQLSNQASGIRSAPATMIDDMTETITKTAWRERLPIAALVVINVVACFIVAAFPTDFADEVFPMIGMGIAFSQVMLLAMWAALGTRAAILRVTCSLVLLAAPVGALAVLSRRDMGSWNEGVSMAAIMLIHWLVGQLPLWILRIAFHVVLVAPAATIVEKSRQFSVGELLWVTGIVGVLLALGRVAYASGGLDDLLNDREGVFVAVILVVGDISICLLAMFAALAKRAMAAWLVASLALTCFAGWAMELALRQVFTVAVSGDFDIVYWLVGTQFVWLTVCSLLMRWAGYRCMRRR